MSDSIRLLYLRAKLLGAMVNKFLVGMFTGLGSSLISSGCCHSISRLSDTTFVPWLAYHVMENVFPAFWLRLYVLSPCAQFGSAKHVFFCVVVLQLLMLFISYATLPLWELHDNFNEFHQIYVQLTVLTLYAFLYGRVYLALSGVGETIQDRADILGNTALSAALNAQFLFQIGVFTAVPMILGFILEQGFLRAVVSFVTMQFQLCTVFFTFSLGTRTHYFGRTILHGGARYQATGRGFVVRHIKFTENYRLYSRSHFVKGMEIVLLLVVYLAYGYNDGGALSYILLTVSSWFLAISWLFAPYLFNPSGFEWQKTVEDFRDWTNWLLYRGGIGVKGEESWEAWWDEELSHIRTFSGRVMETILSLRFFIFQYGIVYKLDVQGTDTSLTVYGFSWIVFAVLLILFKVFTFSQKISVNFQLLLRFIQGVSFLFALAGLAVAVALTNLSITDIFACILAFLPTGWGILSIACAWKPVVKKLGLWKSIRSIARLYDAAMGILVFIPIALCSWFPFVSTFQTRLMYNQAFSRGLEISLILAGNNPNTGI